MTLQVALVGTDGIVLASDRKNIQPASTQAKGRQSSITTKIAINKANKIAVAWAGHEVAEIIGKEILLHSQDSDWEYPLSGIQSIGEAVYQKTKTNFPQGDRIEGEVIVVLAGVLSKFYAVRISPDLCTCNPYFDKRVTGDMDNPAIYFTEAYYQKTSISRAC